MFIPWETFGQNKLLSVSLERVSKPVHEIHNCCSLQLNAKCRTLSVRSLFYDQSQSVIQSTTTLSSSLPNFCICFRQSALLKSHFVKSRVIGPPSYLVSASKLSRRIVHISTKPISVTVELSCCCYCSCPRLGELLDAPFASLAFPVVRRSLQSFPSPVPNSVLQVTVVQVAVAQAVANGGAGGNDEPLPLPLLQRSLC